MKSIKKLIFTIVVFILSLSPLFAQRYSTGAILDPDRYQQVDAKPRLLTRNYTSLPRTVSLKHYSPIPENQGDFGTCVGWATAFAARTISESTVLNRTNQTQTSNSAFSPIYIYKQTSNDPSGQRGMPIAVALDYMKNRGAVKRLPTERTMNFLSVNVSMYINAQRYTISNYVRLFDEPRGSVGTISGRVLPVKKSLSEGKPVIIGMNTPESFFRAQDVWQPTENPRRDYGGHAMCVVGYDDSRHGGAFEVQNSWGTEWGNNGYIWIKYEDFASFVDEAYEIIENLANYRESTRLSVSIEVELNNQQGGMPVTFDRQGFYRTRTSYPSGTEFRFMLTNRYPAYVYSFAADSYSPGTTRIFPARGVSPVLDYSESSIAWPGERLWIRMDDVAGTDYLVVLFSKEELDIAAIEQRFANERGTFPERVARAVGSNFVPYGNVQYNANRMEFSAVSINPRAVFGLLLAIDHHAR